MSGPPIARRKTLFGRKSVVVYASLLGGLVLQLVAMLVLTRLYTPDVYGEITWTMSFVAIFDCIANLGLNNAHIKRVSEGKDLADCVSTFTTLKLLLTAVMAGVVLLSTFTFITITGHALTTQALSLIIVFLVYQIMYDMVNIALLTFAGREQMAKGSLVTLLDPMVRIPFIFILAFGGAGVVELALTYVIGSGLVLIVGLYLWKRERVQWKRPTLFHSYFSFAAPAAVVVIMEYVSGNIDKLLVGGAGTPDQVAFYSSAKYLMSGLGALGVAVYLNSFPSFSRKRSEGKNAELATITSMIERYVSFIATPAVIVLILFPEPLAVFLFSTSYAPAAEVIRYLSIATLVVILNQVYLARIMAMDKAKVSALLLTTDLVCSLSLIVLLISTGWAGPPYIAAAVALAITAFVTMGLTRVAVRALSREAMNWRMLIHAAAAVGTLLLLAGLSQVFNVNGFGMFLVFLALSYLVFEGLMLIIKELRRSDIDYLMQAANLKGILHYVAAEFKREK
ncbi:MAG: oligosaccharide flippase family protein [Methanomassiliicoccales archaeon]